MINLSIIDGYLRPDICHYFIKKYGNQLQPSTVVDPLTGESVLHQCRTSRFITISNEDLELHSIKARLSAFLQLPLVNFEPFQLLRYEYSQEYKHHHDWFKPGSHHLEKGGQRIKTVLIYLNDVELGGETYFPYFSKIVEPVQGRLVLFDDMNQDGTLEVSLHAGMPVLKGVKLVLVSWIRQHEYILDARQISALMCCR